MPFRWDRLLHVLPPKWHSPLQSLPSQYAEGLQEIRIRQGQPVLCYGSFGEFGLGQAGLVADLQQAMLVSPEEIRHLLSTISQNSLYALSEELRSGYVTIPGGHRVGLVGRAVVELGRVKSLKYITGFNIRLAREVPGCGEQVLPFLQDKHGRIVSTLIISPPQAGKTTLLRDLTRSLSDGTSPLRRGYKVVVVDERSELAACHQGVAQLNLGPRCDVLDACPKAEGMMIALRALSPEVLVTDEIGKQEDAQAVEEALHCGVTVLATAHGNSLDDLMRRPALARLLAQSPFERYVFLSSKQGPGTVEAILDGAKRSLLQLRR